MSIGLKYFFLNVFFIFIIVLIIFIWIYSKWHILGPKFNSKRKKIYNSLKLKFSRNGNLNKVKRGAIISDNPTSESDNILDVDESSLSAQELLSIQSEKEREQREIKKAEQVLALKQEEKNKQKEMKEKNKEIKQKQKEISKKLKEEEKNKKKGNN